MNLNSIPAFQDNYIWVLSNNHQQCLIVDPGEAGPILKAIDEHHWQPAGILLTHHHADHVGGVKALLARYPLLPVWGPEETRSKGANHILADGDRFTVLGISIEAISTPGHTSEHLCYYSKPYLFCGDTLFSGGCGRLFEGTPEQMYQSFQKLNRLPANTLICCAHEYTLSNLLFAAAILPGDPAVNHYLHEVKELRSKNQKTLPSTLEKEREINLFLRIDDVDLINEISKETSLQHSQQRFAWLRAKKDSF
ncbi:hydroxyacylglutathione hydrolase [Shimwellia pseudoproteus]|uniref:hydroxyacylglutathione hydrolase n=1 Tax=Shimwellia pseudoproteus TaxID=570012 RepID=UPI0018EAB43D|nr:hydroxyacylglutathione hydrolase [Shimwellia pseudoproteus]MBJ3816225.1 hydroxyacylglutathione hydrolase [Shimwellia pseudoproteus]